jgi:hypothetical protein
VGFVLPSTCLSWYTHLFILVHQLFKRQRLTSLQSIHYFRTTLLVDGNIFYPFKFLHDGEWCFQLEFLGSSLMSWTLLTQQQSCINFWWNAPPPINLFGFCGSSQSQEGSIRNSRRPFGGPKVFLMITKTYMIEWHTKLVWCFIIIFYFFIFLFFKNKEDKKSLT